MDRERGEMERGKSELRMTMEELCLFSSGDGEEHQEQKQKQKQQRSSTMDLLCVSKQLLHVLDGIGPTLLVLRQDVQQNIQRLQDLYARDPSKYESLTAIVADEVEEGTSKKVNSCTRAIFWLAKSIDFSRDLLQRLLMAPESSLREIVDEAYRSTLKPWHGWISSAAYRVALNLVPEREMLVALLMGNCHDFEDFSVDVKILESVVQALLDEINAVLVKHQLDKLKST